MLSAPIKVLAPICLGLLATMGAVSLTRAGGALPLAKVRASALQDSQACTFPDTTATWGPTVVSDLHDGVSSDGRGPYSRTDEGVIGSHVDFGVWLTLYHDKKSAKNPRTISVNLNNPVPDGGGVPLGIITDGSANGLHVQWRQFGKEMRNLHRIPVGETVTAPQMNVSVHVNGQRHLLQMGPQLNGHCHNAGITLVNGKGTSSGTIFRASRTKWVMDLPGGSVGRLFDISKGTQYAVDKGLYFIRLHFEIGN